MTRIFSAAILWAVIVLASGCENLSESLPTAPSLVTPDSVANSSANPVVKVREALGTLADAPNNSIPQRINGVELTTIRGWHANLYPWAYDPSSSGVHPVLNLWTPGMTPSPSQVSEQCRQIRQFGGGAAVLEYSPNPALGWHNYWLSVDFARDCGPFYLLYEEINGTRFIPPDGDDGPKNMSSEYNRRVFKEDIDFMFRNVILPNQSRYVTINGRAIIYMWATSLMVGDFASLMEEVKAVYPVAFIGDEGGPPETLERTVAFDGFMPYGSLDLRKPYVKSAEAYRRDSFRWRQYLRGVESATGKKILFIPTFQAAYDDTKVPGRSNPPFYAQSREEVEYHAELIRSGMGTVYDNVGPFVIYGELPEGAAVIESQCRPDTMDRPGRWVGCGTARLEILKKFFSF